jgi:hypothetical protein
VIPLTQGERSICNLLWKQHTTLRPAGGKPLAPARLDWEIVTGSALMTGIDRWMIPLCFGAVVVAMYSWTRFDEPSYDGQSEHFARYKPWFATSSQRYWRAKWSCVGAITLLFLMFS